MVLRLERDGVVDLELRCIFQNSWDSVLAEVPRKKIQNTGKHEGNLVSQWFVEDGWQSGQHVNYADRAVWDGAIDEDENGSHGDDLLLDLSCKTLLVNLVFLRAASVDQPRGVKDANIENILNWLTNTYH